MIIDELNKKIADIESLATDKASTIESKVSELQDGLLMVADAVDIIPEMVDEKITAITKEFSTIKDAVKKVKAQKGDKGDRGEPGIDGIGIKGDKGDNGSPDTGEQIAEKLNGLEGVIDTKVLKDFSMPDVKDLERQINTIGNQTLRLLSRPTGNTSAISSVVTNATLTGSGTASSPLGVVGGSPIDDTQIAVRVATTAALAGAPVYANGSSGVGATLTRGTNGVLPAQDGVTLEVGDRILVKNQASTLQNGIYEVTSLGSASTKWVLTRTTDADSSQELDEMIVAASEGTTNRAISYGQQTNNPTIGTSAITFTAAPSVALSQATTGTQAINQIPLYTGTARQLTRGTANFKYNPTNDVFTIRGIDYTFPANNGDASQVLTTDGSGTLSWETSSGSITEGAPTQADRASVDITVLNTDYNQLIGTQLKFGTVPNQQIFEFIPRGGTEPSSPIIGVQVGYSSATNSFHALGSTLGIQDGDTITINGRTYTWQLVLTNVNNHVQLGITDSDSIQNMIDAINLTGTPGTQYASAMTINADVSASSNLTVTANIPGTGGNSITTTASISSGDYDWSNPTLVDGVNPTNSDVADGINSVVEMYSILADNKLMSSTKSGNTVTVYSVRPGTYGNGISIDSTNDTAVTPSSSTTSGGLNNGTPGTIGSFRKGITVFDNRGNTSYIDNVFQAIDNNVWIILSSSKNDVVTDMYSWTNT